MKCQSYINKCQIKFAKMQTMYCLQVGQIGQQFALKNKSFEEGGCGTEIFYANGVY